MRNGAAEARISGQKVKHTERESKRNTRANSTETVASQKDDLLQIITVPFCYWSTPSPLEALWETIQFLWYLINVTETKILVSLWDRAYLHEKLHDG